MTTVSELCDLRCSLLIPLNMLGTPIPGSFIRISDNPLFEWHGFATVTKPGNEGFSLVVSRAGDWTAKQIDNPPSTLWVRGAPTFGVLRIVPLFRRLVFVATGSGIGPCAPCILEQRVPIKLLWTSPNVRETFGDEFVDSILKKSPGAVIYGQSPVSLTNVPPLISIKIQIHALMANQTWSN